MFVERIKYSIVFVLYDLHSPLPVCRSVDFKQWDCFYTSQRGGTSAAGVRSKIGKGVQPTLDTGAAKRPETWCAIGNGYLAAACCSRQGRVQRQKTFLCLCRLTNAD